MFDTLLSWYNAVHTYTKPINESKFFAGVIIIIINLSAKLVDVRLSKPMESYFKNTFSRQLFVFAIAWMPTRDVFVAFVVSTLVIFCVDYLMNDESALCVLPERFTSYHRDIEGEVNGQVVTQQDVNNMNAILDKMMLVLEKTGGVGVSTHADAEEGTEGAIVPGHDLLAGKRAFGPSASMYTYNT